jgi:hypothetical protein
VRHSSFYDPFLELNSAVAEQARKGGEAGIGSIDELASSIFCFIGPTVFSRISPVGAAINHN